MKYSGFRGDAVDDSGQKTSNADGGWESTAPAELRVQAVGQVQVQKRTRSWSTVVEMKQRKQASCTLTGGADVSQNHQKRKLVRNCQVAKLGAVLEVALMTKMERILSK